MPMPHICRWRYFPIDHSKKVVRLEPYRTKSECQALGGNWDGIHGEKLQQILTSTEDGTYKFLPDTRGERRGGFRGNRSQQTLIPTKRILISLAAKAQLQQILASKPNSSLREILSNVILATDLNLWVRGQHGPQPSQQVRVTTQAHAHLMEILSKYKDRHDSNFTILAVVDTILAQHN
jgi:hypothetical protein